MIASCFKISLLVGVAAMNALINALPAEERRLIAPHLLRLDLHRDHLLVPVQGLCPYFYFPTQAVLALRAPNGRGQLIEIGVLTRKSVAGAHLLLGTERAPCALVVVTGGSALAVHHDAIMAQQTALPCLWRALQRAAQQQWTDMAQEAAAIAGAPLGWRLARLLWARFSAQEAPELVITHEELAQLLHARRAGITQAVHALEGLHAIRARRGLLQLRDRAVLQHYVETALTSPPPP